MSDIGSPDPVDVEAAHKMASAALRRADQGDFDDYDWVLITWRDSR
jgi:hypothetical protein